MQACADATLFVGVIDEEGDFTGIYSDRLRPVAVALGGVEITRASEVEFAHARSLWEARKPGGELIAEHTDRALCIRLEVKYLEAELLWQPYARVLTDADLSDAERSPAG